MKTEIDSESVRQLVRQGYGKIAEKDTSCCSGVSCCGSNAEDSAQLAQYVGYSAEELAALPDGANMGLSCGNPNALAALQPGEVVLDLGSGGGFDVFIAARKVGATGRAIGVDMTPEMLGKARKNIGPYRERSGLDNVEFRLGEIEHLPLADNSVDVVISNCVINLSPDKAQVWREIARVMKPGGRMAVSDLALLKPLPAEIFKMVETLIGCVAGAVLVSDTERMAREAGLTEIRLNAKKEYVAAMTDWNDPLYKKIVEHLPAGTAPGDYVTSLEVTARKPTSAVEYTPAVNELVAMGAAIAANCEPCLKYHYREADQLGVRPSAAAEEDSMSNAATAEIGQPLAEPKRLAFFERYLTVWVFLCMVVGVALGRALPDVTAALSGWEFGKGSQVNVPIGVLLWLMIYPMMLKVDFGAIGGIARKPKGLMVTLFVNWLVKPFSMALLAWVFMQHVFAGWIDPETARGYTAGLIILAAAPCTAMVFVWSYLTEGDPAYTLVQVAVNDLIMLVAFAPIVMFLCGVAHVVVPAKVLIMSVVVFIVIPLTAGWLTRTALLKSHGKEWFETRFLPKFHPVMIGALLLTLVLIFAFQSKNLTNRWVAVLLIAVPIILQVYFNSGLTYLLMRWLRVEHSVAAPGALIGASNFFELAVAVAITLFGADSPAALATVVGVLVEVPVMLSVCNVCNRTRGWFGRA